MPTLAADLDRQRTAHRARRMEQVLVALQVRRDERCLRGEVPPALDHAIRDFTEQLRRLEAAPRRSL
jgi:hypothetical protein